MWQLLAANLQITPAGQVHRPARLNDLIDAYCV